MVYMTMAIFGLSAFSVSAIGVMYDVSQLLVSIPIGHKGTRHIPCVMGTGMIAVCIASLAFGVGSSPLWTLAQVHIDNSVRTDLPLVPKFISWFLAMGPLGVMVGFVMFVGIWYLLSRKAYGDYLHSSDDLLPLDAQQALAESPKGRGDHDAGSA
eukprot:gene52013-6998_t